MISVGKHSQEKSVTIRGICGKIFSQAACGGVSHRLRRFTRILGAEEKDTNHTDVAQEKNLWQFVESVGKYSLKQHAEESPQITQIYTDIGYGEEGHESHGRSTRKICDNPWYLWDNTLKKNLWESVKSVGQHSQEKICENPWNPWEKILKK